MIIEVCVDSLESAVTAIKAGADQVELVSLTEVGGITPSIGLLEAVLERGITTMAMVRPRAAGFCYSDFDKEVMLRDVEAFRRAGAQGVVFGALNADGTVDFEFSKRFCEKAGDMDVVFHRAFEVVKDKMSAARELSEIGVRRILTKGGNSLVDGQDIIRKLLTLEKPEIISGGVRENTIELIKDLGLKFVHVSSGREVVDTSTAGTGIYFGKNGDKSDEVYTVADSVYLERIVKNLRASSR